MFNDVPLPASVPEPQWLIDNLLPAGQLVLLHGPSGVGKTLLSAALLASIDHTDEAPYWISAPDELEPLTHRHLLRHGVQPEGIHLVAIDEGDRCFNSEDADEEASAYCELLFHGGRPKVIVLDALEHTLPFLAKLPPERQRRFFRDLRRYAAQYGCTFLVTMTERHSTLARAVAETARVVLALDWHPHDRAQRLLTVSKNQLAPAGEQFQITLTDGKAAWHAPQETAYLPPARHARPSPRKSGPESYVEEAAAQLHGYLRADAKPAAEVKGYLGALGYTPTTVRKALASSRLTCERRGDAWWYLPAGAPLGVNYATTQEPRRPLAEVSSRPASANRATTQEPCLTT